ncbi:hypothetical protein ABZP36_033645 [Zizania latifolia]
MAACGPQRSAAALRAEQRRPVAAPRGAGGNKGGNLISIINSRGQFGNAQKIKLLGWKYLTGTIKLLLVLLTGIGALSCVKGDLPHLPQLCLTHSWHATSKIMLSALTVPSSAPSTYFNFLGLHSSSLAVLH